MLEIDDRTDLLYNIWCGCSGGFCCNSRLEMAMTRKVIVYSKQNPNKKLEFTVKDWLENFLVCEICGNSNSFLNDFPNEDPKDHVHYFTKLIEYPKKKVMSIAN